MKKREIRRPFVRQFYRRNKLNFVLAFAATVVMAFANLVISWLLQQIMDLMAGSGNTLSLGGICWVLLGIVATIILVGAVRAYALPRFFTRAMGQYKDYAYSQLLKKNISTFSRESTSTYLSALSNDANSIEVNYLEKLFDLVMDAILCVGAFFDDALVQPPAHLDCPGAFPAALGRLPGGGQALGPPGAGSLPEKRQLPLHGQRRPCRLLRGEELQSRKGHPAAVLPKQRPGPRGQAPPDVPGPGAALLGQRGGGWQPSSGCSWWRPPWPCRAMASPLAWPLCSSSSAGFPSCSCRRAPRCWPTAGRLWPLWTSWRTPSPKTSGRRARPSPKSWKRASRCGTSPSPTKRGRRCSTT